MRAHRQLWSQPRVTHMSTPDDRRSHDHACPYPCARSDTCDHTQMAHVYMITHTFTPHAMVTVPYTPSDLFWGSLGERKAWAEPPPSSLMRPQPLPSEAGSVAPSFLHP